MIEYIKHYKLSTKIFKITCEEIINQPVQTYIKNLCLSYLFSYEGYKRAVKKQFDIYYKIPLYINEYIQLIPLQRVKNYENIWINVKAIKEITHDYNDCKIIFYSGRCLIIKNKHQLITKQIKRLEQINKYISKHFHV